MKDKITTQKIKKYFDLTSTALKKVKKISSKGKKAKPKK